MLDLVSSSWPALVARESKGIALLLLSAGDGALVENMPFVQHLWEL
jgi:hypothetical protein